MKGAHTTPLLSIPSFPTFLLGTYSRHRGRLCVPRIPTRKKQLDAGRLTSFFHLQSAAQRRWRTMWQECFSQDWQQTDKDTSDNESMRPWRWSYGGKVELKPTKLSNVVSSSYKYILITTISMCLPMVLTSLLWSSSSSSISKQSR